MLNSFEYCKNAFSIRFIHYLSVQTVLLCRFCYSLFHSTVLLCCLKRSQEAERLATAAVPRLQSLSLQLIKRHWLSLVPPLIEVSKPEVCRSITFPTIHVVLITNIKRWSPRLRTKLPIRLCCTAPGPSLTISRMKNALLCSVTQRATQRTYGLMRGQPAVLLRSGTWGGQM